MITQINSQQWPAVSYRYRIEKVLDAFFEYRGKYRKKIKVSVSYREKSPNFNPVPILLDQ